MMYTFEAEAIKHYPDEILDMIDHAGFFSMYETLRKAYFKSSYTNREIYEQVEEIYIHYFKRRRYKDFESFNTQYKRFNKKRIARMQHLKLKGLK